MAGYSDSRRGARLDELRAKFHVDIGMVVPPKEELSQRGTSRVVISGTNESAVAACAQHFQQLVATHQKSTASPPTPTSDAHIQQPPLPATTAAPAASAAPAPAAMAPTLLLRRPFACIIIDNSDVFHGAQLAEHGIRDTRIRLNVPELVALLQADYQQILRRIVTGSVTGKVWELYKSAQYHPVPDMLYENALQILDSRGNVASTEFMQPSDTDLVLATGNGSQRGANYPGIIRHAVKANFHVHLWVWKRAMPPIFGVLLQEYPNNLAIHHLDDHRAYVAYAEGAGRRTRAEAVAESLSDTPTRYTSGAVMPTPMAHISSPRTGSSATQSSAAATTDAASSDMAAPLSSDALFVRNELVKMGRMDLVGMFSSPLRHDELISGVQSMSRHDLYVRLMQAFASDVRPSRQVSHAETPSFAHDRLVVAAAATDATSEAASGMGSLSVASDGEELGTVPGAGQPAYVFVDNSNVFGGAQLLENGTRDKRIRVNIRNLTRLIERGLFVVRRVVAGSFPPPNSRVWDLYRIDNYVVLQGGRKDSPEESLVDEALHSHILDALNEHKRSTSSSGTLVLVTGDGNSNMERGTSFVRQAERAARDGWIVHVWAWKRTTARVYRDLASEFKSRLFLHELDKYRKDITFTEQHGQGATVDF